MATALYVFCIYVTSITNFWPSVAKKSLSWSWVIVWRGKLYTVYMLIDVQFNANYMLQALICGDLKLGRG